MRSMLEQVCELEDIILEKRARFEELDEMDEDDPEFDENEYEKLEEEIEELGE